LAKYHGKSGRVMLSTTGTGDAATVVGVSAWSLDRSTDTVEVTAFGDTNKQYVQGLPDVSGDFSGFYDETETKLFTASTSADGCKIYLYPSTNALTKYAYGPAWLSVSYETGVGDAVTVSGSFVANGAWGSFL
jgi:hypothetical protein